MALVYTDLHLKLVTETLTNPNTAPQILVHSRNSEQVSQFIPQHQAFSLPTRSLSEELGRTSSLGPRKPYKSICLPGDISPAGSWRMSKIASVVPLPCTNQNCDLSAVTTCCLMRLSAILSVTCYDNFSPLKLPRSRAHHPFPCIGRRN